MASDNRQSKFLRLKVAEAGWTIVIRRFVLLTGQLSCTVLYLQHIPCCIFGRTDRNSDPSGVQNRWLNSTRATSDLPCLHCKSNRCCEGRRPRIIHSPYSGYVKYSHTMKTRVLGCTPRRRPVENEEFLFHLLLPVLIAGLEHATQGVRRRRQSS